MTNWNCVLSIQMSSNSKCNTNFCIVRKYLFENRVSYNWIYTLTHINKQSVYCWAKITTAIWHFKGSNFPSDAFECISHKRIHTRAKWSNNSHLEIECIFYFRFVLLSRCISNLNGFLTELHFKYLGITK